jgi:hypothetical protein
MRRRRFVGRRCIRIPFDRVQATLETGKLAHQLVDGSPLRGEGIVQVLNGFVLVRKPDFEFIYPLRQSFPICHVFNPAAL